MKKIHYVLIGFVVLLVITNPSLKDFKDHLGDMTVKYVNPAREHNYFICSTYDCGTGFKYFAVAGNFFTIKKPIIDTARVQQLP
jgi:hypothetical protein